MGEKANQEGARTVKEQAILTLDIDELKMIVRDAIAEALENFGGLDNQDNQDNQNEIMSRSDIAKYLGINPKNVMSGSPLAYYVPFDKPMITTKSGKRGWRKSIVMEHLARRDKDIRQSYSEWLEINK